MPRWLAARKRDANGNLLGLDYPTVVPFMQNATSDAARQSLDGKNREGGEQNLLLLDRTLKLRYELRSCTVCPTLRRTRSSAVWRRRPPQ
jgi:hypothetical protein